MDADARTWATIVSAAVATLTLGGKVLHSAYKTFQGSRIQRRIGADVYDVEAIDRAVRYYVEPNCTSIDPAQEAEPRALIVAEEPVFGVLDRFLSKESVSRYFVVLADSGMGKSSLLLSYYARNQTRRRSKRHRIAIVHLGLPDADERIQAITQKNETSLFLDAFDEDTKAFDHRARIAELVTATNSFRRVLLTSRTQFFASDEEIPQDAGVIKVGPRGMEKATYEFRKLYLAPFSEKLVRRYLRLRYPGMRFRTRRKALQLVEKIPSLSVRPMLLTYLPDLLGTNRAIRTAYDLYEELLEKWYIREAPWVDPKLLKDFSSRLAVDLFINRVNRGSERIPGPELLPLATAWGVRLGDRQLRGRSLLNRDAAGNYKFSHRSIMEFLVTETLIKLGEGSTNECSQILRKYLTEQLISEKDSMKMFSATIDLGLLRLTDQIREFIHDVIYKAVYIKDETHIKRVRTGKTYMEESAVLSCIAERRRLALEKVTTIFSGRVGKIVGHLIVPPILMDARATKARSFMLFFDPVSNLQWFLQCEESGYVRPSPSTTGVIFPALRQVGFSAPSWLQKLSLSDHVRTIVQDQVRRGRRFSYRLLQNSGRELNTVQLTQQVLEQVFSLSGVTVVLTLVRHCSYEDAKRFLSDILMEPV